MKIYIRSDTHNKLLKTLKHGFEYAQCSNVTVSNESGDHCQIEMNLPSGRHCTFTAWVNSSRKSIGKPQTRPKHVFELDDSWSYEKNGDVKDSDGTIIGKVYAVELSNETQTYQKSRKDYDLNSIRIDSGDVIIDHPEKAKTYDDIVDALEQRTITHRS